MESGGEDLGRGEPMQMLRQAQAMAAELGRVHHTDAILIRTLVQRVEVGADRLAISLSLSRLIARLRSDPDETTPAPSIDLSDPIVMLTAPFQRTRIGREMKLLVTNASEDRAPDPGLLRVIARAHDVHRRLAADAALTVHDIAREEGVTSAYLYILLRLRWLAPDVTTAIVNGQQPPRLNAKQLMRLTAQLPADWSEQRVLLGFV